MNVTFKVDASGCERWLKKMLAETGTVQASIYNDVPYVPKLEYGSSRQAPHGMVRVSLREIGEILQRAVAGAIVRVGTAREGNVREEIVDAVNKTADVGMGLIRDRTPIRTGRARRGWRTTEAP